VFLCRFILLTRGGAILVIRVQSEVVEITKYL